MPLLDVVYCTREELERKFSALGVQAFSDHEEIGTTDDEVVEDAINEATSEINAHLLRWHSATALAAADIVKRWCIKLALKFLCESRGNPVPDTLQKEFERIMARLERLRNGDDILAGVPFKSDMRPAMSNMTIDRRYRFSKARVTSPNSTDVPTTLSKDRLEQWPYE